MVNRALQMNQGMAMELGRGRYASGNSNGYFLYRQLD